MDAALLTETITVKHKTGVAASGDPTYGSPVTFPARIERAGQRQVSTSGDQLNDTTLLFTVDTLSRSDLVWFPEDDTSSSEAAHRPVSVEQMRDLDGVVSHYEVTF